MEILNTSNNKLTRASSGQAPGYARCGKVFMPEKIMPCPFCGSIELHVFDEPSQADDKRLHQVYCLNCRALGPRKYTAPEGITAWNDRAHEQKLRSALELALEVINDLHWPDTVKEIKEVLRA